MILTVICISIIFLVTFWAYFNPGYVFAFPVNLRPLTIESNILTKGFSVSADGLLIGLNLGNDEFFILSSGFMLSLFTCLYLTNYQINVCLRIIRTS